MAEDAGRDEIPVSGAQVRVRRSVLLFTVPLALLAVLTAVLVWESIRSNVTPGAQSQWPWRLHLMDTEVLGSLLALSLGVVLARAQYARTVRPHLGWRGIWVKGALVGGAPAWRVGILNGGQYTAVIDSWNIRVVLKGEEDAPDGPWKSVSGAAAELATAGFVAGVDFRLIEFGAGFPLMGGVGGHETVLVGAFSEGFARQVESLYVRARVTDVAGDTHERITDCMKGMWTDRAVAAE
ncbi:hypothetical protein ACFCV8_22900 [Streptomyces sp. NPDC056347]|uniref:hypothetical protein n=1 Tax=Streptomyces sp. NPDC056347 TaxID=3345790 RepID=UPI0035D68E4D